MDFGFGSLVDKFDERIGKRPTSAILWLTALALFVVCIRTIITEGIVPLVELVRGVSSESTQGVLGGLLIGLAIAIISGAVFVVIVRWLIKRTVAPLVERAKACVDESDRLTAQARASTDEMLGMLEQLTAAAEERGRKP